MFNFIRIGTQRFNSGAFPGGVPSAYPGGAGGFPGGQGGYAGGAGGFPGGYPGGPQRYPQGPQGYPQQGFGGTGIGNVGPVQFPNGGYAPNGYGGNGGHVGVGINNQFGGQGRPGYYPGGQQQGGYFPGGGIGGVNGNVLVGPAGPTGIIGRPNVGYQNQRGQAPAVLVGPGGPTGIVGRPPAFGGYGLSGGAPNGYGGQFGAGGQGPSFNSIGIDIQNGVGGAGYGRPQGGFGGPQNGFYGQGGPGGILPYNSGSGIGIHAFDEPENVGGKKKAEGKGSK